MSNNVLEPNHSATFTEPPFLVRNLDTKSKILYFLINFTLSASSPKLV